MLLKDVDFAQSANTFLAVFLGAFLATIGGLVAGQVEAFFHRRAKERGAALLFGEVLTTLQTLLRLAAETRGIGDPYGPITLRMLRAARRELEVYDRNRETLYELRDGPLRVRLHTLVLRLNMPLESLLDVHEEIGELRMSLKVPDLSAAARLELEETLATRLERRDGGFDFLVETAPEIAVVVAELGVIAKHSFARYQGNAVGVVQEP